MEVLWQYIQYLLQTVSLWGASEKIPQKIDLNGTLKTRRDLALKELLKLKETRKKAIASNIFKIRKVRYILWKYFYSQMYVFVDANIDQ